MSSRLFVACALLLLVHAGRPPAYGGLGGVRGFVTDSTNGEALIFANVAVRGTPLGTTTNLRGYFHIPNIPAGRHTLAVTYLGYHPQFLDVDVQENEILQRNVRLVPGWIELDGITVTREPGERPTDTDIGLTKITARDIAVIPPGLESDIFRVLQTEPGVGTTGDVSARYYVRGGGGDQNLLLLDGATIYNPFHALGVFSVIDPEVIAAMEFHKGGFAPEHSGRLSSILNVVTRDGNKNRFGAAGQIGLLSAKLAAEGPIPAGSFLVAGRTSISAGALQRYLPGRDNPFEFYDVSLKVNSAASVFGENSKVVLHGFLSDDRVRNRDPLQEDYYVRNNILGVSWHKVWNSPLVSTVRAAYTGYDGEVLVNASDARPRSNTVRDLQTSADFTYMFPSRNELAFGVQSKALTTALTMQNLYGVVSVYDVGSADLHAYASYRFKESETFGLTIGLRAKFLTLTEQRPTFLEPRVIATYAPLPILSFKGAIGWYAQEVVTLTDESEVLSVFDPWVIVPRYLSAPQAWHFIAGVSAILDDHCSVDVEAYYKPMRNLVDINEAKSSAGSYDFVNVSGRSYGVEASVRFDPGDLLLQGSYALGRAERTRIDVAYTPKYDVRHAVHLLAAYTVGTGFRVSASWTFKSGLPFTPAEGFSDRLTLTPAMPNSIFNPMQPVTLWGARNSRRLPVYHRLDLGAAVTFPVDRLEATVEVSLMNLYNRKNIFYYDRDTGEEVSMLRFFPSISLRVAY